MSVSSDSPPNAPHIKALFGYRELIILHINTFYYLSAKRLRAHTHTRTTQFLYLLETSMRAFENVMPTPASRHLAPPLNEFYSCPRLTEGRQHLFLCKRHGEIDKEAYAKDTHIV